MQPVITSQPPPAIYSFFDQFVYQVIATGNPRSFAATGLPNGVQINPLNGLISGTPSAPGTYGVHVSATNPEGTGTQDFSFTVNPPPATPADHNPTYNGPIKAAVAVRVIPINEDGTPAASAGGSTAPGAPTQVAEASGDNFVERDVTVTTENTVLAAASSVARYVEVLAADSNSEAVYLSVGRDANVGLAALFPAGGWCCAVPIKKGVNAIVQSGAAVVTVREYL